MKNIATKEKIDYRMSKDEKFIHMPRKNNPLEVLKQHIA